MGAAVPIITAVAAVASAGAAVLSATKSPSAPKIAAAPAATPRANSAISDALARRRGAAANQITGPGGAESSATAKKTFMGN